MGARWRHLVDDEAQSSDAATFKTTLPTEGALHALMIKCKCTNGATEAHGLTMRDVIDEVRVMGDGSKVLFTLSPVEIEKRYEAYIGKALVEVRDEGASAVQQITLPILFGLDMYDPNFYLPLDKYKTVKLEVDYSPTISGTAGFTTATTTFDVMALLTPHDEPLSYQGTIITRRIFDFTSLATGVRQVELDANKLYRDIGIYAYEAGVADNEDITLVSLEDTDRGEILFEAGWDDLVTLTQEIKGAIIKRMVKAFAQDNDTVNMFMAPVLAYGVEHTTTLDFSGDIAYLAMVDAIAGDQLTLAVGTATIVAGSEVLATYATDAAIYVWAEGKAPSYFGLISYKHYDYNGQYLDSAKHGKLVLKLTEAAAGAQVYVSVQEVRVIS